MKLQDFLNNTPASTEEEVAVSKRLVDPDTGELYKFKIRPLTDKEYENARNLATTLPKRKKDPAKFNNSLFDEKIVIDCTIYPNFKDAHSIQATGCISPEQYLHKVLLPGEVSELSNRIIALSGFDNDMDELIEDAKNS